MQNAGSKVEHLLEGLLSKKWKKLSTDHPSIEQGEYPGVYVLAFTQKDLEGKDIDLSDDVFLVGMSNARRGVNGRLKQFADAIEGRAFKHRPGKRFFDKWCNGTPYSQLAFDKKFFVTGITNPCQVKKEMRGPEDLREMGNVAALEFYVLARVKEVSETNSEPPLNKK
jgi:hypothetical protein